MPITYAIEIIDWKLIFLDYKFLGKIENSNQLKKLSYSEISLLCEEIRDMLITTVSQNGGHLASNLGAVELTVALHRSLDLPKDSLIFDVGHQCYTHKLLSGRYDRFSTLRKENGLSGFMRPDESPYDTFVTGHASNSIAAAFGIYKASVIKGEERTSVAVIGDGALTGGLAFEALNNIGYTDNNFIVVLNDNKMSISNNVGSMSEHLKKIRLSRGYYKFKYRVEIFIRKIPFIGQCLFKVLSRIKHVFARQVYKNNLFESFGFKYIGPVDGHDVEQLETAFEIAKIQRKPCVVHTITTKGKGYSYAEEQPGSYHGVSAFDTHDGLSINIADNFSTVCGKTLCKMAEQDGSVCAITAAMTTGTGLEEFSNRFGDRFFDVGIAEEYAATFASGLAAGGMRPYFAVYSSFLQRTYDEVIHDCAIAKLPVCFLVDRAGIVGDDGETHQGLFDVAFMSTVPGMTVYSPASYSELAGCLNNSVNIKTPLAIRYPRGKEEHPFEYDASDYTVFSNNGKIAIVTYGIISSEALKAQQMLSEKGIKVDLIKLNKVYPVSDNLIQDVSKYEKVYFFEEGMLKGGISEHIVSRAALTNYTIKAIDNTFVSAADIKAARAKYSLDKDSMFKIIAGEN